MQKDTYTEADLVYLVKKPKGEIASILNEYETETIERVIAKLNMPIKMTKRQRAIARINVDKRRTRFLTLLRNELMSRLTPSS